MTFPSAASLRSRWDRLLAPRATDLPNPVVLWWFPVLAAIAFAVLTTLTLSGTSSGSHWRLLESGPDPRLVSGQPRDIRSDEWLVAQSWTVAQAHRDYPATNPLFPGGTDATITMELPNRDWSTVFRPHLWGHLLFGLNAGEAWQWWLPALGVVVGAYLLCVVLMPRRPLLSAALAVGVLAAPMLQWWYTASSAWSIAWPMIAMAGVVWAYRDPRLWTRLIWAATAGYLAVTMTMGLYVPFIIPGVLVFLAVGIGSLLSERRRQASSVLVLARRLIPIAAAGVVSVLVVGAWWLSHAEAFHALASTVYPGLRTVMTGSGWNRDPHALQLLGAPWNELLRATPNRTLLGSNSSEGSTVILVALFALPVLVFLIVRSIPRGRPFAWLPAMIVFVLVLVGAFVAIPGWDGLAHVLLLDRAPAERYRFIFVTLFAVVPAVIVSELDRRPSRWVWIPALVSAAAAIGAAWYVWYTIKLYRPDLLQYTPHYKQLAAAVVVGVALICLRRVAFVGAVVLLAATAYMSWGINPVYRGVFDLSETAAGRAVVSLDRAEPGAWVALGSPESMAVVMQSADRSYSGVQSWPDDVMWEQVDPRGRYEHEWNRLAHIHWEPGSGSPRLTNRGPDIIQVNFDACAAFAQKHVRHVLSDVEVHDPCLTPVDHFQQGPDAMVIYDVVDR